MATGIEALQEHIAAATVEYRKGEIVEERAGATHIYAMPPAPETGRLVDVHFIQVGFTDLADKDTFVALLGEALRTGIGEFGVTMTLDDLMDGLSYITLGGWLGSQDLALRFIALGDLHGLWTVLTPQTLGLTGRSADEMAGSGYVMFAPKAETRVLLTVAVGSGVK